MRIKKTLLFSLFFAVLSLILSSGSVFAIDMIDRDPIKFTPNIPIPGSEKFGGGEVVFDEHSGTILALYIRDLYDYGAGLAGVVALFMLIFAGWKWLMAAGSSEKISAAKSVVNNVLIGLLLLFGGYLLLSQISERLVNLRGLVVPTPTITEADEVACAQYDSTTAGPPRFGVETCGQAYENPSIVTTDVYGDSRTIDISERGVTCMGNICSGDGKCVKNEDSTDCPQVWSSYKDPPNCSCQTVDCAAVAATGYHEHCAAYNDAEGGPQTYACRTNACFGTGPDDIRVLCRVDEHGTCSWLFTKECSNNGDCFVDVDGDGTSEACCVAGKETCDEIADLDDDESCMSL